MKFDIEYLAFSKKGSFKREIIYYIFVVLLTSMATFFVLKLWMADIKIPFVYTGDVVGSLGIAQNNLSGGSRYYKPNIGAPFLVNGATIPDTDTINYFIYWLVTKISGEVGVAINVFYLLTYIFIALISFFVLRQLEFSPIYCLIGSVVFACLPYHQYRGESHMFLSTYYDIPWACLISIWIMRGQYFINDIENTHLSADIKQKLNWNKILISVVGLSFLASGSMYYLYFSLSLMFFASIIALIRVPRPRTIVISTVIVVFTLFVFLINILPSVIHIIELKTGDLGHGRAMSDSETYGLKISQLILPVAGHKIPLFARIRGIYDSNFLLINENSFSTLGLFLSISLIVSIFSLMANRKKDIASLNYDTAVLNLFVIFLSIILSSVNIFIALLAMSTFDEEYINLDQLTQMRSQYELCLRLLNGYI